MICSPYRSPAVALKVLNDGWERVGMALRREGQAWMTRHDEINKIAVLTTWIFTHPRRNGIRGLVKIVVKLWRGFTNPEFGRSVSGRGLRTIRRENVSEGVAIIKSEEES